MLEEVGRSHPEEFGKQFVEDFLMISKTVRSEVKETNPDDSSCSGPVFIRCRTTSFSNDAKSRDILVITDY